jgi:hypothetical protein
LKSLDQAFGTDIFSGYDMLYNAKESIVANEKNRGSFIKNRKDRTIYNNNADIQAQYAGTDDNAELESMSKADTMNRDIEKYNKERMALMAQLSAEHNIGKYQTKELLHNADIILNQSNNNNMSQIRQGFYNDFNAIKQQKSS